MKAKANSSDVIIINMSLSVKLKLIDRYYINKYGLRGRNIVCQRSLYLDLTLISSDQSYIVNAER